MRSRTWFITGALCLFVSFTAFAQHEGHAQPQMSAEEKAMMEAWQKAMTPGAPHKQLDGMVGTWNTTVKMWMAPAAPVTESTGTSENKWVLGGRYIEQRFKGTFMGQPFEGIGYTGYDNVTKQFTGMWMDNMSTGTMVSNGWAQADGKTWHFRSTMADPATGRMMPIDEKVTVVDKNTHIMEMWAPGPDGKMYRSMEITYKRKM